MNLKIYNEMQNILHECPSLINDDDAFAKICSVRFGVDIYWSDIDRITQEIEQHYFTKIWQPKTKKYKYSGLAIVDEINNMKPKSVLDVGCGYNEFKGKIHNLIGIDPYNDNADFKVGPMDFRTIQKFDVILCLGSVNFGGENKIIAEVGRCVSLLEDGGIMFFRVNPGLSHDTPESKWVEFFAWNVPFIIRLSEMFNLKILDIRDDTNSRKYFVYKKA